ncbi:geranylgeranyl diphosphate reductase [Lichenicola sp.]|uniref:geranylgeranyl diphosphate reductase n=1 Tax=Lichenicola sp. TaxID=2804529 RepID=UPI003B00D377
MSGRGGSPETVPDIAPEGAREGAPEHAPEASSETVFDCVVVGGGPAGATAASELARRGRSVVLLDREGRIKPCGGAIPPRLIEEFEIPDSLLVARITGARIISPSARIADMPIGKGFVGMVDRDSFDGWLRERAASLGAVRRHGVFERIEREADGVMQVHCRPADRDTPGGKTDRGFVLRARSVIGADGARSAVARAAIPGAERMRFVFAYHEIIASPTDPSHDAASCEVHYRGSLSPDFYGWVFPHGKTTSVGLGSALKGFQLRPALDALRKSTGLSDAKTIRREGGPIPLRPLRRWDNGRDVVLAGDAAGVVAPASGEGIYYAMTGGHLAAEAIDMFCATGDVRALRHPRRRFMRAHGQVFWVLGIMQRYWYSSDMRRERFVSICRDKDVQQLTWAAYMTKELVRAKPLVHLRIFAKNIAHLTGLTSA